MRKIFTISLILLLGLYAKNIWAQSAECDASLPFCTGELYSFPMSVDAPDADPKHYYDCCNLQPNPAWYHMKIKDPGQIQIHMVSTPEKDIDFVCWGPFDDPIAPCEDGMKSSDVVDCSYSTSHDETCIIPNGQTGEYYILMMTNFSKQPCDVNFSQTGGDGTTDCSIVPPPIGSNTPLCTHDDLLLTADSYANATYYWTGPSGWTSTEQNPIRVDADESFEGIYTLIVTFNGTESDPISTPVGVHPLPIPEFSFENVCFGEPITFDGSLTTTDPANQNIASWVWDLGDGNTQSEPSFDYTYADAGEYTVSLTTSTGAFGGCPRAVEHQVTVGLQPIIFAGDDQTIPNGAFAELDGSIDGGSDDVSFEWQPADKLIDNAIEDPTTISLGGTVEFTLEVIDHSSNCISEDNVIINVTGGALSVLGEADPPLICLGSEVKLKALADGGAGDYTYTWTSSLGNFTSDIANPSDVPAQVGTIVYTVEVKDGYNTVSTDIEVVVAPNPIADAGPNIPINVGTSTTIDASASDGNGNYSYSWTPISKLEAGQNTLQDPKTVMLETSQEYVLVVTDGNACVGEDAVVVIAGGDALDVFPTAEPDEMCFGESTTLYPNGSGGSGEYNYEWENRTFSSWSSSIENPIVFPTETSYYVVTVFDGYKQRKDSVHVIVNQLPLVKLMPESDKIESLGYKKVGICNKDSLVLDAGHIDNPPVMNYLWNNSSSDRKLIAATNGNFIDTQEYIVRVQNPVTQCINKDTLTVVFNPKNCTQNVIDFQKLKAKLKVEPNPTQHKILGIKIDREVNGEIVLSVRDVWGRLLEVYPLPSHIEVGKDFEFDLNHLDTGVYYIEVSNEDISFTEKLILQ